MSEQKRGYMQEIDAWLTAILITLEEENETDEQWLTRVKAQIKQKLLESYRLRGIPSIRGKPERPAPGGA